MDVGLARRIPLAVALSALLILPSAALAAPGDGTDPNNPSLDQYVESVPSSHGDRPRPPRHGSSPSGHLSPSVRRQLQRQGGSDAQQLGTLATSPSFGAPTTSPPTSGRGAKGTGTGSSGGAGTQSGPTAPSIDDERRPSSLDALTTAATSGDGTSNAALVVGLVLIAAVAGGTALARRRSYLT